MNSVYARQRQSIVIEVLCLCSRYWYKARVSVPDARVVDDMGDIGVVGFGIVSICSKGKTTVCQLQRAVGAAR